VEVAALAAPEFTDSTTAVVSAEISCAPAATSNCLEEGVMRDVNLAASKGFEFQKIFSLSAKL
jgi:hypothetical protein